MIVTDGVVVVVLMIVTDGVVVVDFALSMAIGLDFALLMDLAEPQAHMAVNLVQKPECLSMCFFPAVSSIHWSQLHGVAF